MTTKRILLVEDNMAEAELVRLAFKDLSISIPVVHFRTGKQLIDYLLNSPTNDISFILTDLNMPGMNGKDLLERILSHQDFKRLPVLVFSSSLNQDEIDDCYRLGAKAFINKPLGFNELKNILKAVVHFWAHLNVPPMALTG